MKKLLLLILLCIISRFGHSQLACYAVIGGVPLSTSQIDKQTICTVIGFVSDYVSIPNYSFVQREWFYNGQSIRVSNVATDNGFQLYMRYFGDNTVYCVYTLQNQQTHQNITSTTNSVTVFVKEAGIYLTKTADPVIGCPPPITLSYALENTQFVSAPLPPFLFQWQLPAGWTQTGTNNPNYNTQITVQPDATNAADAKAIITLSCGVQVERVISFNRPLPPAPTFSTFPTTICQAGTVRYEVTPVCAAVSYTYTLAGSTATFADGTQNFTATNPYCDVVFTSPYSSATDITVKANFANNLSTATTSRKIQFGTPQIRLNPYTVDCNSAYVTVSVQNPTFYSYIDWYERETGSYLGSGSSMSLPVNTFFYDVVASNVCGTTTSTVRVLTRPCPESSFAVAPNPVKGTLRVISTGEVTASEKVVTQDVVLNLYSVTSARLLKSWKIKTGQKEYNFDVSDLPHGNYLLRFIVNGQQLTKQVIVE